MNLGWFEVGMNVADIARSAAFYETLGFENTGWSLDQRVLALHRNDCSITLYQGYGEDPLYLQFWQGDIAELAERVRQADVAFERPPGKDEGEGNAFLIRDPDGHGLFFIYEAHYWAAAQRIEGATAYDPSRRQYAPSTRDDLDFGWFQLSLPVADIAASRAFYEKLGFRALDDTLLQSDDCLVALYGLWLERPQLIFWQGDIDEIEQTLTDRGLAFKPRFNDAKGTGAMLIDPDGHPLYFINQPGRGRPPRRAAAEQV
jgi:catechol 2,3-dioxygenase-like lactoylglutathione lyase family enzyme